MDDEFKSHGLDERAFAPGSGAVSEKLRFFDAFPKTKSSYTFSTRQGGQWTVATLVVCFFLAVNELWIWYMGTEYHHFGVEKGVSRQLQLNIDIVVKMPCDALRVNMLDDAGDRIHAAELLDKQPTSWHAWGREFNSHSTDYQHLNQQDTDRLNAIEEDQHVGHVLGETRRNFRRKFPPGPKLKKNSIDALDSCRIFGSLEGNKIESDLHITARGHGYLEFSEHLDHNTFNFSHMITELSFGPHYPALLNPLDKTVSTTPDHFYQYQYYTSIVPTIYTRAGISDPYSQALPDPSTLSKRQSKKTIFTNQYAVTSQSHPLPDPYAHIPGIFFKNSIEPILLVISEERGSLVVLLVRLVNVAAGVLVTGAWLYQISGWLMEVWGKRRRESSGGMLGREMDEVGI